MEAIWNAIQNYGPAIIVVAVCVICVVCLTRLCFKKLLDKIQNSNIKKAIYFTLNILYSFAGAAIYFAIFHLSWSAYVLYSVSQCGVTTFVYQIFENYGPRQFFRWLLCLIGKWFEKNPEADLTKKAKAMGLDKAIETLVAQKQAEETAAKNEVVETTPTTQA